MKKVILMVLFGLSLVSNVFGQMYVVKDGYFFTKIKDGNDEPVSLKLKVLSDTNKIKETVSYKNWYLKEEYNTNINRFFTYQVINARFAVISKLKVQYSFTPLLANDFSMYGIIMENSGEINISFFFKAQNKLGNWINSKGYYIEKYPGEDFTKQEVIIQQNGLIGDERISN
jgi:hypothetical protein